MKIFPVACFLLIIAGLCACNTNRTEAILIPDHLEVIQLDSVAQKVPVSRYASGIDYIPLQTSAECRIGKVLKMSFSGTRFILLSSAADIREVLVFDALGKFSYKIDRLRDLPAQVSDLYDFDIDITAGLLYVYYSMKGSLGLYDLQTGKLKEEIAAPQNFYNCIAMKDHLLYFREGGLSYNDEYGSSRICEFKSGRKLARKWLDHPVNSRVALGDVYCSKDAERNSMLIARLACDTVFQYTAAGISARYRIKPAVQYAVDVRQARTDSELRTWMYSDRSGYLGGGFFNTSHRIFFHYKHRNLIGMNVYEKKDGQSVFISSFENDINEVAIPVPRYIDDNYFIGLLEPHLIKHQASFVTGPEDRYTILKNLAGGLRNSDNPVVSFITLKKDQ